MLALKPCIQTILRRVDLYDRLRASCVYDAYWQLVDGQRIQARNNELLFYRRLLSGFRRGDLVFDIGANAGEKTDLFLRLGARVIAVEPDDRNQEVLKGKFLKYRLFPKPTVVVGQAISDKIGVETMWIDQPGSALNTLSQKWADTLKGDKKRFAHIPDTQDFSSRKEVATTTLEHLMGVYGVPFFVKIDVEGYELNVLRSLRQRVRYLSFEVNLPEFRQEGLQCVELLGKLAADGEFNYSAGYQLSLRLEKWTGSDEFLRVLDGCTDKGIDVFWRTFAPTETQATKDGYVRPI